MSDVIPFQKLLMSFDPRKMTNELSSFDESCWLNHVNQRDYQGSWDVIPLRCQRSHLTQHPIIQSFAIEEGSDWGNLPYVQQCPEILRVLNFFECEVKSARLMRLKSKAYIRPHRDKGLAMEYGEARFHIPISGTEEVSFLINDVPVPMVAGNLWYVNADMEHSVHNKGCEDRINLVVDCEVNDWLIEQITRRY